ncbi:hypothetical protein ACN28S_33250 [Cystobacter fuscus]
MTRHRILAAFLALPLAACTTEDVETPPPENNGGIHTPIPSDVKAALSAIPGARVLGSHANGLPFMVRGEFGSTRHPPRGLAAHDAPPSRVECSGASRPSSA